MKKYFALLLLIIFSCTTSRKMEKILPKEPSIKLKLSNAGLEREGLWRQNLCISDIDSDGNLDIITPPPRGEDRPVIFLGDGKGNWKEWKDIEFPNLAFGYGGVDVADLDKNGLPDLAIAVHSGRIFVLLQKEKGKFFDFSDGFPPPDKFTSRVVKFSDFDGDGTYELLSIAEDAGSKETLNIRRVKQKIFKLKNDRWEEIPVIYNKIPPVCYGDNVIDGDFNLDGRKDFVISCHHYGSKKILFINKEEGFLPEDIQVLPDSSYLFRLRGGDFNKDGREDLLFSAFSYDKSDEAREKPETAVQARMIIIFNLTDGWKMEEIYRYNAGKDMFQFRAIASGDLDGNGYDDIVSILDNGELYIYLNKDGKSFEKAKPEGFVLRGKSYWMDIKDVNKDGKNDIIVAYAFEKGGGNIDVYINETIGKSVK